MGGLPKLNEHGFLPAGRHQAQMADIEKLFVTGAPHSAHRRRIFTALELYADRCREYFPEARLWVDGGFVTHKSEPPKDVDVVVVASAVSPGVTEDQALTLMTLTEVSAKHQSESVAAARLQPFGGFVDGFIISGSPANQNFWHDFWQGVRDSEHRKGYVEVLL